MSSTHSHSHPHGLAHQFDDLVQQKEASTIGMWAFLITEVLFFGGLFLAYTIYRIKYPESFHNASLHLNAILGGVNTAVLLCSSFTMVLAVHSAEHGKGKSTAMWLVLTILFGAAFLVVKGFEYAEKFHHALIPGIHYVPQGPTGTQDQLFFFLYFVMTGIHGLHMVIGIVLVAMVAWKAYRGGYSKTYYNPVEITGLYWHFVDLVWIFLYPMLYLIDRSGAVH